ncbi:hypothetical protein [Streptomyces sp. KL2]|uniref:hypothetical protein n=1 Tax=Streptomyces sp. KL2 TaxID=3050126 RepID=UPI00397C162C
MIRPVSPRRPAFRVTAATAAAITALLAGCSAGAGTPGGTPSRTGAEPPSAARLTHVLPGDPVRMVLPATGAETRWTQGLDAFGQQVAHIVSADCASERGAGLPDGPPPAFIRLSELPDLDFLARHGFSRSADLPAPEASPTAPGTGDPAAVRHCQDEGRAAAERLRGAYAPLQGRWFRELASLRGDPAAARALRGLPGCLAGHGIEVGDEDGFFALADTRLNSAAPAERPRVDRELGRAYASCMRPVEAVREPARLRMREDFLAEHADEVRELRRTLVPALRRAEERYGPRLSFPAP